MASHPHDFEVRILGPCAVAFEGKRLDVTRWPAKAGSLLRLLAVVEEHRLTRDEAVELLWPEVEPEAGISNLKGVVHRLRRVLGDGVPSPVVLDSGWVLLNPACTFAIDADRLEAAAKRHMDEIAPLEEAADLYRGEPLPEDRYEDWAVAAREYLQRRWRVVCLRLVSRREERGERETALGWAQRLLEIDPLDETAIQQVLRLSVAAGRRTEARRIYHTFERRLRAELGVGPAAETRVILLPPGNLPNPAAPFVGRTHELAALGALLTREEVRLLTLTGPGGVGKTRLALEVAREHPDPFGDGIHFVSLAHLRDPDLLLSAVQRALGVRDQGLQPVQDTLATAIGQQDLLLVLDNLEHLLPGVPAIAALLAACPRLTVLATSRAALHLSAEHIYPVAPLGLPHPQRPTDARVLAQTDAVALFLQRSRAVRPNLALTAQTVEIAAEICRRLEGLPLAIELAAARARFLSPAALLSQLTSPLATLVDGPRDLPERQRTLRDTIDWSYDLLDEPERMLFARLAVFAGGWTKRAAEVVCDGESDPGIDVGRGLEGLVESNLVGWQEERFGGRYAMLETIREGAIARLERSGEAQTVARRHAEYFFQMAELAEPELKGPRQAEWLERLEAEYDNLEAALACCMEAEEPEQIELGLRLGTALCRFWIGHGHLSAGRDWLERGLRRGSGISPAQRARASGVAGWLARMSGDLEAASTLLDEALTLHRELGDLRAVAANLDTLGDLYLFARDTRQARPLHEESLALRRYLGDKTELAMSLNSVAVLELEDGNFERATALLDEALPLAREAGDTRGIALISTTLGQVVLEQGDISQAKELIVEALARHRELGTKLDCALCLLFLACVATVEGQTKRAAQLFGAAESGVRKCLGPRGEPVQSARYDRYQAAARGQLGEAAWQEAWAEGQAMTLEEAIGQPASPLATSPDGAATPVPDLGCPTAQTPAVAPP